MANHRVTGVLATLGLLVNAVLVLLSLHLGFHIEATPTAVAEAAKGQAVGTPAGIGLVAAVVALVARHRRWGAVSAALSVACGAVAAAVYALT